MSGLTVRDLIEALKKFPKDWTIQVGIPNTDESTHIKGIFDCSETDSMGYLQYCFVQIEPLDDMDEYDLAHGGAKMGGDTEWYNTKETFETVDGYSVVKYKLNDKGDIIIVDKKNCNIVGGSVYGF